MIRYYGLFNTIKQIRNLLNKLELLMYYVALVSFTTISNLAVTTCESITDFREGLLLNDIIILGQ